jgi:hypothetical protein
MALEVLAAVSGIRGPHRAGRGGQPSPAWTARGSRSTPACRICRYAGWSEPAGGQSARPDASPVTDVAVVSVRDDHRSEQVAAFTRPALGHTATREELVAYCGVPGRAQDPAPPGVHRRPGDATYRAKSQCSRAVRTTRCGAARRSCRSPAWRLDVTGRRAHLGATASYRAAAGTPCVFVLGTAYLPWMVSGIWPSAGSWTRACGAS